MKTEEQLRQEMRETPAGALLVKYGFEPYDTESSARRVAEQAADELAILRRELSSFRNLIGSLNTDDELRMAKLAIGYGMSATRFLSLPT
jgi:hypothetical protein